jgi:hypothetical protein
MLTVLPKFGEHPTYHIARCLTCGYVNWFPQPLSEKEPKDLSFGNPVDK